MRRTLLGLAALVLLLAAPIALAQGPSLTTVSATLYASNGQPPSGTITISTPIPFISADGYPIPAHTNVTVPVTNGAFSVKLVPTVAGTPGGAYYIAGYNLPNGSYTEYWVVPASAVPVGLAQIRAPAPPVPSISVPFAQLIPPLNCVNQTPEWTSSGWVCITSGSIFQSFQLGSNAPISGAGNYLQITGSSPIVIGTMTGLGTMASPYVVPITCPSCGAGGMVYPSAGIANSTGSAWGTSYQVGTSANDLVQLNSSAQLPPVSAALLTNFPTLPYYANVQANGGALQQAATLNIIAGPNMTVACPTSGGVTNCTLSSTSTASTAWSALTPATNSAAGTFLSTGNAWDFSAATSFSVPTVGLTFPGSTSGSVIVAAPAVAGSQTIAWPAGSGTVAVGASPPLAESAAGVISCPGCATTTNGGPLSASSPITISAAGLIACASCNVSNATVSSVGLATNAGWFTVTNSPVTTTGNLTFNLTTGLTGNEVLATPNGSSGVIALRALVGADIPAINLAASGNGGVTGNLPYSQLSGAPTLYYQTIQANGSAQTQELTVNYAAGSNMTITPSLVGGVTTLTFTASTTASTAWSAITPATNSNAGTFTASGNSWVFSGASAFTLPTVGAIFPGSTSGNITLIATAIAGTNTITLPAGTGTVAISASSPITLSATGQIACATCNTSNATVSSVSIGNLSPLFTASVANSTTTPTISFTLSNAAQNSVFAGPASGGAGAPSFQTAPTFSAANLTNFPVFGYSNGGTGATSYTTNCLLEAGASAFACSHLSDNGTLISATEGLSIAPTSTSQVGLIVNNPSSTTADIADFEVNGSIVAKIDKNGNIYAAVGSSVAGQTVLAFGTAASAPSSAIGITVPTSGTAYQIVLPGAQPSGSNTFLSCTSANPAVCSWAAGGGVTSVSNSDGTLTISPTTGAVVASLALGHANTWTAAQTFPNIVFTGSASYAPTAAGVLGYDTTNNRYVGGNGTNTSFLTWITAAPTTGHLATWSGTLGQLTDGGAVPTGMTYPSGSGFAIVSGGASWGTTLAIPLPVADGGTGTASPGLVAGSGISITGTWPNQTVTNTGGGGGGGQTDHPITTTTVPRVYGLSTTAAVTVANTVSATTIIGASFQGSNAIPAGAMLPNGPGTKTMRYHASGVMGTASSPPTLTVTVLLGGQTLSSISVPVVGSLSSDPWEMDYYFTVTGIGSAQAGGCVRFIGAAGAFLAGCASNASITGLNFGANQTFDVQVTWGTASSSNTITSNQSVLSQEQSL